jgi:beta-phosphoglucomutase-like phosphatase (HAD superfamily)
MNPTAIIFDMDGVLIDSEPAHKLAKERAFARFGVILPEAIYEQYKGSTDETVMNEIVLTIPGLNLDAQEMLRLKHQEFEAIEHLALPSRRRERICKLGQDKIQNRARHLSHSQKPPGGSSLAWAHRQLRLHRGCVRFLASQARSRSFPHRASRTQGQSCRLHRD